MTTGITIALTRQTFVGKVMSLLFNMLSRLVITFLPRAGLGQNILGISERKIPTQGLVIYGDQCPPQYDGEGGERNRTQSGSCLLPRACLGPG